MTFPQFLTTAQISPTSARLQAGAAWITVDTPRGHLLSIVEQNILLDHTILSSFGAWLYVEMLDTSSHFIILCSLYFNANYHIVPLKPVSITDSYDCPFHIRRRSRTTGLQSTELCMNIKTQLIINILILMVAII